MNGVCSKLKRGLWSGWKGSWVSYSTMVEVLDPIQEASLKEMCILVDEKDTEIGHATKRDCHRVQDGRNLLLHRAFSVFLFNSKNELLLQQRSKSKITFPNCITNTCCSHPLYDIEKERDVTDATGVKLAAKRRLNVELGIPLGEVEPEDINYLTRIIYKSLGDGVWGEHEIDYILFVRKDVNLDPNPEEVSNVCYVPKKELDIFLSNIKAPVTPWFQLIVQSKLTEWWENLDTIERLKDHNTIHSFIQK